MLNRELLSEVIAVSDDDAIQTAWTCARRAGLLAGISCGAALWGALQVAARPESRGKRIVVIMPDSGERYISQAFLLSLSGHATLVVADGAGFRMLGAGRERGASRRCRRA